VFELFPTERYTQADAARAIEDATFVVSTAEAVIKPRG
jgi:hypothetical protein